MRAAYTQAISLEAIVNMSRGDGGEPQCRGGAQGTTGKHTLRPLPVGDEDGGADNVDGNNSACGQSDAAPTRLVGGFASQSEPSGNRLRKTDQDTCPCTLIRELSHHDN